jgi:hypothetical protein
MNAKAAKGRTMIGGALLIGTIGLGSAISPGRVVSAQPVCPKVPVVTVTSSSVPTDVCIPDGFPINENPVQYFDDYSWRAFVAIVWPALSNQRGMPDPKKTVTGDGPRVFETYKAEWEMFRPGGEAPSGWDEIDKRRTPCGDGPLPFGDMILDSFSKFGALGQAGFGDLMHALPAQNRTWVRFSTGFNRSEYEQIVGNKLYLRSVLEKAPVTFKNGAIDVKSSWMEMTGIAHPERYYTRTALVLDPVAEKCVSKLMGLVGLHIVQKTPSRPQWIWSTFEHVDNVPPPSGTAPSAMAFNDGKGTSMPKSDPNGTFPPNDWAQPAIYNVVRRQNIHKATVETNQNYQKAIGGVWQFYQLVMTQWPLQLKPAPIPPTQSGAPAFTFPGKGANTSFANTTLETWDQETISTGCMNCHTVTQVETDYLWVLNARAFSPPSAVPRSLSPSLRRLKRLMQGAGDQPF